MKKALIVICLLPLLVSCDLLSYLTLAPTTASTASTTVPDCEADPTSEGCAVTTATTEEEWIVETENNANVYAWIKNNQLANGLQKSSDVAFMVSLYDNALAALVYIMYDDFENAERIFDFFDARIETELQDDYGGFAQFHALDGQIYGGAIGKRWLGDNAWLLIALNYYRYKTGSDQYDALTDGLDAWIRSLQQDDGSLMSGYDEGGTMMGPVTEAMIDSYNAVMGYDQFHVDLLQYLEQNRYDPTLNVLTSWPDNPSYEYAIDMSSWGFLGMNDMPVSVLSVADDKFMLTVGDVTGYCIDEDLDAIWPEHTLQMAVAYIFAGPDHYDTARAIIANMEQMFIVSAIDSDTWGLPYASSQATMYGAGSLWEGVDVDIYLSSSAWYLFAKNGFNPFEPGLLNKEELATGTPFYAD